MNKLKKQMELANEAVKLIEEFVEVSSIVRENSLNEIKIKNEGAIIEIDDEFSDIIEYPLNKISSVFSDEMRGYGPCNASFYEAIGIAESELESNFDSLSEIEFKKYVGNLKYAEYRCEAIYKRLIEIEAQNL